MQFCYQKIKVIKEYICNNLLDTGNKNLQEAVYHNNIDKVNDLINNKGYSNIDCKDNGYDGASPLMVACYFGYYELVKILIKNGANVNFNDDNNSSPITNAIIQPNYITKNIWNSTKLKWEPKLQRIKKKPSIIIKILDELLKNGVDETKKEKALYDAIHEGNSQVVLFLLQHHFLKSDINKKFETGWYKGSTILDLARDNHVIKKYLFWYSNEKSSAFYFK